MRNPKKPTVLGISFLLCAMLLIASESNRPAQPTDPSPLDGETYYILNQRSGMHADLHDNSTTAGDHIVQQPRSFTNLSQRWAFSRLPSGFWQISNLGNGLCLDSAGISVVQNRCTEVDTQQWSLNTTSNGYYTISNKSTGLLANVTKSSTSAGVSLDQTALSGPATQSQQWLLRPAFFRGLDNALLEKQEAARVTLDLPWWKDAGRQQDVLQMLKNHGINMVRLRPSPVPPYANVSQAQCDGDACYGETDAQDLDLAKRTKNLGMSIELTLLYDGANSLNVPPAWAKDTHLTQLQSDLYNYVKAEILSYRRAGTMPDMVSIGNEVDTGFLGAIGSPTGANFGGFAALQTTGMQAVKDAAADTSIGPAIPAPLTCIHITPAWDLTQFFTLANHYGIPYDAICQSFYPIYHGPLTEAQAVASNPNNKPVEQLVLESAANNIRKPILILETGEHYENGFESNDAWYAPPTTARQCQFLLDLQAVVKGLPNNLGMGLAYWDPAGVNIPEISGGLINGGNLQDAIYIWNGLTLFDNADTSGSTNVKASNYSMLLPGVDALGGKLDPSLSYKFVNLTNGRILSVFQGSHAAGAQVDAEPDDGNPSLSQQWRIISNNDGYFRIASLEPGPDNTTNVLGNSGGSMRSGSAITQTQSGSGRQLEWNIVSAGGGYFRLVNRLSGLVLDIGGGLGAQAGFAVQEPQHGNSTTQQWQIVPVHR